MNLVGKIFIVLICVMSLFFMGLTVAVYATHQNWKEAVENPAATADKPLGLRPQVERQKERNQELKDKLDKLAAELATERAAKLQRLSQLEIENDALERQREQQQQDLAKLVQERDEALAAMKVTQEAEAALRQEVEGLRKENLDIQKERNQKADEAIRLTDDLHELRNQYQTLRGQLATLTADLTNYKLVWDKLGLKDPEYYEGAAPVVDGVVLAVGAGGLIEISIGSDEGLTKGHRLEVYRKDDYLGRVEVTETAVDKSVCKVLPEFRQRPIQRDDRVTTKLR